MTELTDRMRTCAAGLLAVEANTTAVLDAALLLSKAADLLEAPPEPLGEPMSALPSSTVTPGAAAWVGIDLPPPPSAGRACPSCGATTARTVKRIARTRTVALICPVCSHQWELA